MISRLTPATLLLILLCMLPLNQGAAQSPVASPPIDLMVLIDNSCSMFPANQIRPGCDAFGGDPTFLRITGANTFIARLGFNAQNESDYQLGIISVGDEPELISPLLPVAGRRDSLAALIAKPKAQPATRLLPALEMGYNELHHSATQQSGHLPALVLITDGVPWPREDQKDADFEKLIAANKDVPLFIMLLQNKEDLSPDFENYILFWERLQGSYSNLFVYRIRDASEIQNTYNTILGQLQDTIPGEAVAIKAGNIQSFFVNSYLERIIITLTRKSGKADSGAKITDGRGNIVQLTDDGVTNFLGEDNPVEVYSIASSRLKLGGTNQNWTIETDSDVTVMIDREGAYRINILSPSVAETGLANVIQATNLQTVSEPLQVRFNLVDKEGSIIQDPQRISGSVVLPDGSELPLPEVGILVPDLDGEYQLTIEPAEFYPKDQTQPIQLTLLLNVGALGATPGEIIPITSSRLVFEIGKVPFIRSIAPTPVLCEPGQPLNLRVNIGDTDGSVEDTLRVRIVSGSLDIRGEQKEPGQYQIDLSNFCAQLIQSQTCSTQKLSNLMVQVNATLLDGNPLPTIQQEVQAQVISPACTPTALPTPTPTATPAPTPIPDTDLDGLVDSIDRCPTVRGWQQSSGCVPWDYIAGGAGILGLVAFSGGWLWPWVRVRAVSFPPDGYVMVCREGIGTSGTIDLRQVGIKRRAVRIKIGSDSRQAQIVVPGLKPVEFMIERHAVITALRDPNQKEPFAFLDQEVAIIHTSDPQVILKASMSLDALQC